MKLRFIHLEFSNGTAADVQSGKATSEYIQIPVPQNLNMEIKNE